VLQYKRMPRVNVDIPHRLSRDEARTRIMGATSRLEREYNATCLWDGETRLIVTRKAQTNARVLGETEWALALYAVLGFLVAPRLVRMVLVRKLQIGLAQLILGGTLGNTQYLVKVPLSCHALHFLSVRY